MSSPTGIDCELARAYIGALNLMLTIPGLDVDTERRARWLKVRLQELAPDEQQSSDFIDAKIAWLLSGQAGLRAAA